MEAVLMHSSQNQHMYPYKSHVRNPKRMINSSFISRPGENFFPSNIIHTGLLQTPNLFLSHSFPPYSFPQQPPLLPQQPPVISRGLSCPPVNRKPNNNRRSRDSSLTPKKPKASAKSSPKKVENLKKTTRVAKAPSPSECMVISSTDSLGPDPKDLPKDVSKVLSLSTSSSSSSSTTSSWSSSNSSSVGNISVSSVKAIEGHDQMDTFSGSVVFTLSPPPSSLPLPTFSLRPKLSCNAEAAGIDAGATDNLRRLLRLV